MGKQIIFNRKTYLWSLKSPEKEVNDMSEGGLGSKVKLRVVYEDPDVVVMMAPNEEELRNILLELLKEKPMNLKELHEVLSGIASEDKIRRALSVLLEQGRILSLPDGKYKVLGLD